MSEESYMTHNSFKFGSLDMWDEWELRVLDVVDYLKPRLRSKKKQIPERDGSYDFGAEYYDERVLSLKCIRMSDITRHFQHELAYALAEKSQIRLYDDPTKYYVGRIYSEPELMPIRNGGLQVTLEFTCEPFLRGLAVTESFTNMVYLPEYNGTRRTPTVITIKNTGNTAISGIRIIMQNKRS